MSTEEEDLHVDSLVSCKGADPLYDRSAGEGSTQFG